MPISVSVSGPTVAVPVKIGAGVARSRWPRPMAAQAQTSLSFPGFGQSRALGPGGTPEELSYSGNRGLAEAILAGFTAAAARRAAA